MLASEFPDHIEKYGIPLYITTDGRILSVFSTVEYRVGEYPTVALAHIMGKDVTGYHMGYDGCVALGMNNVESLKLLGVLDCDYSRNRRGVSKEQQEIRNKLERWICRKIL